MNFEVITLFPKAFELINNLGVITRALEKNLINVNLYDLREYGEGSYRQVDDKPYGGGAGMVLKPEPIYKAHDSINKLPNSKTLLMTPQGKVLKQRDLLRYSSLDQLIIICGQYEGFDERIRDYVDEEISGGDFICLGGEVIAMVFIEAISRLRGNILGNQESAEQDTFSQNGILEYPQYTRPSEFRGQRVPEVLLSGHHARILEWRSQQARQRTLQRRPELLTEKHKGEDARLDESS